jgi:hypothetical protein
MSSFPVSQNFSSVLEDSHGDVMVVVRGYKHMTCFPLLSDYNLLEEMLRQTESAKRARAPLGAPKSKMHPAMQALQHQAKMRDTALVYWPHGMSKRKSNSTFFDRK